MGVIDSIHETNKKAGDLGDKFLSKSYEYYRLKIFQQVTISVSMIFKIMIVGGLILVALVFMSVAAAFKIGDLVNSYSLGFVLVGVLYLVISFIVFLFRKHINNAIIKSLSKPFFSQDENI
ncbi:hypothetical protein [Algibacter mikhailovii]|uniref:Competence protein n=1 Tax=Algibacter mikhailovii TaxID=425498 RepID=A0A918V6Z7_9FLAO|nr:hypothetical protein [Algibacter mikhailovii]GGZ75230.1 hypothetical protein GCM10007028_10880 [Algibacter mikhailovii]